MFEEQAHKEVEKGPSGPMVLKGLEWHSLSTNLLTILSSTALLFFVKISLTDFGIWCVEDVQIN